MHRIVLTSLILACSAAPLAAEEVASLPKRSSSIIALSACRAVNDPSARLACFDREVVNLEQDELSNKVVIVDRADIERARRGLFGFKLPSFGFLSSKGGPELKRIDAFIASIGSDTDGRLRFTLQDGAHWRQIDSRPVSSHVKTGTKVTIKEAALGSYFAIFENLGSVRVLRTNK